MKYEVMHLAVVLAGNDILVACFLVEEDAREYVARLRKLYPHEHYVCPALEGEIHHEKLG